MRRNFATTLPALGLLASALFSAHSGRAQTPDAALGPRERAYSKWHEAVPGGGGTDHFQDKNGEWWCAFFGTDNEAPFREKPAMMKINFAAGGKIMVSKYQPDFVLQK